MSVQNLTDQDVAALKNFYEDSYIDTSYRNNPFLAMVPKEETYGSQVATTIKHAYSAAHGPDFTTAYNALANSMQKRKQFFTPWFEHYGLDQIPQLAIDVSSNKEGAIVNLLADALEGSQRVCAQDLEKALFNDGFGVIGTISTNTNPSGNLFTLVLTNVSDTYNFQVGDLIVSSSTATAALDTGTGTVTMVDNDAGSIQLDGGGTWTPTNAHVLFQKASKISTALTTAQWLSGLSAYLPLTAPASTDSFMGVNRFEAPSALAGRRVDGRNMPIKKAVNKLLAALSVAENANPEIIFMDPLAMASLQDELQGAAVYVKNKASDADVFFEGIQFNGPKGKAVAHAAWGCPPDRIFALTMKHWKLHVPGGKPIRMGGKDKDGIIDLIAADGIQVRSRAVSTLTCEFPGGSGVAQIK